MVLKLGRFIKQITNNLQDLIMVLKKGGGDQLDRSCGKSSIAESQGGQECPTHSKTEVRLNRLFPYNVLNTL
jgi:hypothetical protein